MTAVERTGWRDEWISTQHRTWGDDLAAIDIDWLVVEYTRALPAALVEYKHYAAKSVDLGHPSYRAIAHLANAGGLPFFIVRYFPDVLQYRATPVNPQAHGMLSGDVQFDEPGYASFIRRMRRRVSP